MQAALERWELVRSVHGAISELAQPYREVLVLRDLEGLSGADTCAALDLEATVMKRASIARGRCCARWRRQR